MVKFKFEGKSYECNPNAANNYKILKKFAQTEKNPAGLFEAYEFIFDGKDEEYAEGLGYDLEKMSKLAEAALEAAGSKK